jgi:hypothetical protein
MVPSATTLVSPSASRDQLVDVVSANLRFDVGWHDIWWPTVEFGKAVYQVILRNLKQVSVMSGPYRS